MHSIRHPSSRSRGITLVEVLVSIIVLSLGMLGLAGLQAATTKYRLNTWARTSVASLFSDMSDRIRANPTQAGANYNAGTDEGLAVATYAYTADWASQADDPEDPDQNCAEASCTAEQLAAYDIAIWRQRARQTLPQGSVQIQGSRATGYTVTLMWFDKDFLQTDGELDTAPTCTADMTGLAQQSCCPESADVEAGVRCANMAMIP